LPAWLVALRPQQWPKNGLVAAAFVFSAGSAWDADDASTWWPLLWRTGALFVAWAAVSSATYLVNDVMDRERDREHPRKRRRPIAAGGLGVSPALVMAAVLAVAGIAGATLLEWRAGAVTGGYFAGMLAYSLLLKQVPIVDVLFLTAGVVARAASGALTIDVEISPWLYVCSGFGAFFLATSKRWAEYRELGAEAASHRPSLAGYSDILLNQMLMISAATALLSYGVYSVESANVPANGAMALTIPFVAVGMFRYLLLLDGKRRGDAPDQILFTDPGIVACVAGFVVTAAAVLLAA
jgi:4-hydroxybenzoate polyprenyltransferase